MLDGGRGARASVRLRRRGLTVTWTPHPEGGEPLAGLRAVVTGSTSGIGRAIAETYAAAGAAVLLTHRDSARAADEVATGSGAWRRGADPAGGPRHAAGGERLVAQARDALGGFDIWVNNAGADVLTGDAAGWEWERKLDLLLAVDLKGTIACSKAAGELHGGTAAGWDDHQHELGPRADGHGRGEPRAVQRRQGRRAGLQPEPGAQPRPARARQRPVPRLDPDGLRRAGRSRIPQQVATSTPLGRWGRPQDVAAAALYLASPEAAFVTGQALSVNGGVRQQRRPGTEGGIEMATRRQAATLHRRGGPRQARRDGPRRLVPGGRLDPAQVQHRRLADAR